MNNFNVAPDQNNPQPQHELPPDITAESPQEPTPPEYAHPISQALQRIAPVVHRPSDPIKRRARKAEVIFEAWYNKESLESLLLGNDNDLEGALSALIILERNRSTALHHLRQNENDTELRNLFLKFINKIVKKLEEEQDASEKTKFIPPMRNPLKDERIDRLKEAAERLMAKKSDGLEELRPITEPLPPIIDRPGF